MKMLRINADSEHLGENSEQIHLNMEQERLDSELPWESCSLYRLILLRKLLPGIPGKPRMLQTLEELQHPL